MGAPCPAALQLAGTAWGWGGLVGNLGALRAILRSGEVFVLTRMSFSCELGSVLQCKRGWEGSHAEMFTLWESHKKYMCCGVTLCWDGNSHFIPFIAFYFLCHYSIHKQIIPQPQTQLQRDAAVEKHKTGNSSTFSAKIIMLILMDINFCLFYKYCIRKLAFKFTPHQLLFSNDLFH